MELRNGRKFYTDAELAEKSVPCPLCGERAHAVTIYAPVLIDFECFSCGATWRGGPKGDVRRFLNLDICLQRDQVREVAA
jgi:hypothetical protein